jgi:hypothetical protein
MIKGSFEERKHDNSHDSLVTRYEDMNTTEDHTEMLIIYSSGTAKAIYYYVYGCNVMITDNRLSGSK